jgi:hypothetical protein
MWRAVHVILLTVLLFQFTPAGTFAASPEEITSAIEARYRITRPAFLGGFKEIGTVLSVRREGLRANRPSKIFSPNVIKDHRIERAGGGDLPPGGNIDPDLKVGSPLHLYGVSIGDDYVELDLYTVSTFVVTGSATRGPTPLQASVRFIYDKGLDVLAVGEVLSGIEEWFSTDGISSPMTGVVNSGVSKGNPMTVHLGQLSEEVVTILGPPSKIFLLGPKTVFVYQDIKVIFVDGKVTDAE